MDRFFKEQDPETVLAWAESRADAYRWPRAMLYLPVATFSFFVLGLPGFVSYFPAVILLFLQVLSAAPGDRKVQQAEYNRSGYNA